MRVRAQGVATRSDARRICTEKARGAPGSHLPRRARVRIEITWRGQCRTGEREYECIGEQQPRQWKGHTHALRPSSRSRALTHSPTTRLLLSSTTCLLRSTTCLLLSSTTHYVLRSTPHLDPARLRSGERLLTLHPDRARRHLPASARSPCPCPCPCPCPWAVAVVARR